MPKFSTGGTSFPDILIGILLIAWSLISIVLNPIVFVYNSRKPRSIPKFLFQVLSATDFLTSIISGSYISYTVLKEGAALFINLEEAEMSIYPEADAPLEAYGITTWLLNQTPGFVASVMAVCRYIQIRRPFQKISLRLIVGIVTGVSVCNLVLLCCLLLRDGIVFSSMILNLWPKSNDLFSQTRNNDLLVGQRTGLLLTWTATLGHPLAFLASALTMQHLYITYKNPVAVRSQQNGRRSNTKILLLNLGAVFQTLICVVFVSFAILADDIVCVCSNFPILLAFVSAVFPVFLSSFNPIIFLALTPKLKRALLDKICHLMDINNSSAQTGQTNLAMNCTASGVGLNKYCRAVTKRHE